MAAVLGTGPVHVYIGISGTPNYYGTTREGPDITEVVSHYPVMNDLTGPALSIDDGYAGREDHIALVMTRWKETLDQLLEKYPTQAGANPRGAMPLSTLGSMIVHEGLGFPVWLIYAGAGRAGNVAEGMPKGRLYFSCELIGPNKPVHGLKENMKVRLFKAKNIVSVATNSLILFSEADADLAPAIGTPIS